MLLIYTGDGKGKTSACVGQAIRALGQNMDVVFGQFMKKDDQAGEQRMLKKLLPGRFLASGAGFYRRANFDTHRAKALELLDWVAGQLDKHPDMLILDETLYALGHELITETEIRTLVTRCAAQNCHLVLSGRGAPTWLVKLADIVSDMNEIKHIHAQGGTAQPGIEF